jgi:alkylation response protein AidB-like acyl-CoA dehydrogenase
MHTGMGYSKGIPMKRYFWDAKIMEIVERTCETHRMVSLGTNWGYARYIASFAYPILFVLC